MSEYPENPGPLPAEKLCNKYNNPNPIKGEGALGNETTGEMHYEGKGDKKSLVETLQKMFRDLEKYDLGDAGPNKDGVDGTFRNKTENAVKQFQEEHKDWDGNPLKVDGLVGPETADALNREMVGRWYDHYQTPEELVEGLSYHTATSRFLKKGLQILPRDSKKSRIFFVGSIPQTAKLRIRLHDAASEPITTDVNYRLLIGDKKYEDISKDGWIVTEYPDQCVICRLEWGEPDESGDFPYKLDLAINCYAGEEKEQAIAKLHNIGYPMINKYEDNVKAFQQDFNIKGEYGLVSGENLPQNTRKGLWDIYEKKACDARRPPKGQPLIPQTDKTRPFRVRVIDPYSEAYKDKPFRLSAGEKFQMEDKTDPGNGTINVEIPFDINRLDLDVWTESFDEDIPMRWSIEIFPVPPESTPEGASIRLRNLGYYSGEITKELTESLRDAIEIFQWDFADLEITRHLDPLTCKKLKEQHDI